VTALREMATLPRSDRLLRFARRGERQHAVGVDLAGSRVWLDGNYNGSSVLSDALFGLEVSQYQQTALVLELTRLDGRRRSVFRKLGQQGLTDDRVSELAALDRDRTRLCQWIRSVTIPGACFGLRPYHESDRLRDRLASELSTLGGVDDSEEIHRELDALRDLRASADVADEIWAQFERIDSETSERGVQIAVRALLNLPSDWRRDAAPRTEKVTEQLVTRIARVGNILTGIPSPRQWATRDLYARVHRELWDAERDRDTSGDSHSESSARAVVTRPRQLEQVTGSPELTGCPNDISVHGWILYRLFRQARYGGVVYPHPTGSETHLVNPWVDTSVTDERADAYRRLWRDALFDDALLGQVFEQVNNGPERTPLRCPLCAVSVAQCGGDTCDRRATIARHNRQLHQLVSRLRTADESG